MTAYGYGAVALDGKAADIQPVGTAAAAGSTGMGADAGHVHAGFALLASTGAGGHTLGAAAGTILTWTAPADGALHLVMVAGATVVTAAEAGGAVELQPGTIGGTSQAPVTVDPGGGAVGVTAFSGAVACLVDPGVTVTLVQSAALTGGAAVTYAALWGR